MSIDRIGAHEAARAYVQNAEPARASKASGSKGAEDKQAQTVPDQVSLSAEARTLAVARKAVESAPDVREEKIAAIRKRIENGTYNVSSEALAKSILDKLSGLG
jgi:negative regulator of flagellin synthesis FlgM